MDVQQVLTNPEEAPEYGEFEKKMYAVGVIPTDRGNGHWQVKTAKHVINYYPFSANRTIYVPSVPYITGKALRYQNAEIATVVKLVQELKEK